MMPAQLFDLVKRYSLAGLVNGVVAYTIIFFCMAVGLSPTKSNMFGYAAGLLISFWQSRRWVFRSKNRLHGDVFRFAAATALAYLANLLTLWLAVWLGSNAYLAQVLACGAYVVLGFLLNSLYVFSNRAARLHQ